jgi:hypothetical protein
MAKIIGKIKTVKGAIQAVSAARIAAPLALLLGLFLSSLAVEPAAAIPSFARQTGQTCSACHTAFPQLTPFGRRFKLGGYTLEGGDSTLPPLAMMVQSTYTNFGRALTAPAGTYAPPSPNGGFDTNNNYVDLAQQVSLFYGGKVYGNIGAFVQFTYANNYTRVFALDQTDIRYADTTKFGDVEVLWGLTANNNPTVQDVWNTTPVWSSPFISSGFALSPVASTLIESFGPSQQLGGGAYVFINDMLYLELAGYGSLTPRAQTTLGACCGVTISGVAPYWRAALEHNWGDHSLEVGTYGMSTNVIPNGAVGFGTDNFLDVAIDTNYQWIHEMHAVTVRGNYIVERQLLNASSNPAVAGTNPTDYLRSLKIGAEYVYDHTYSVTATYFQITGSPDAVTYMNNVNTSPNSSGWIFDLAYLPFSHGAPQPWPWFNTRLGISYTLFTRFDGGTTNIDPVQCPFCRNANNNNTLLLYAFTAF